MIIFMSKIICVTNRKLCQTEFLRQIEEVASCRPDMIVLREKDLSEQEYAVLADCVTNICERYHVLCVWHNFVELAKQRGCRAIHLPLQKLRVLEPEERSMFSVLGSSCHSIEEAREAEALGCHYIFVGHIFETECKKGLQGRGLAFLREICANVSIPVYGIGGICEDNIEEVLQAGASGVAIMSGFMSTVDVKGMYGRMKMRKKLLPTVLSIAGSDSSGGAGIQADLKTMLVNGVYGMTAITALTAQNTMGVHDIMEVPPKFLEEQLDAVFQDIVPDAVKIGMISSGHLVDVIAERLQFYQAKNIVLDPVMIATSGSVLSSDCAIQKIQERLFPMATVVTPNIPEAEILAQMPIRDQEDMEKAAKKIGENYQCAVLIKGGHEVNEANDLLYEGGVVSWYFGKRIENSNTHGTGCTLSSAIAAGLAKGMELSEAIGRAKEYISGALLAGLDLGQGSGPLHHGYQFTE